MKKCAFDIDSLLKPTNNNSSYIDDTEDNSSDDGQIHRDSCSSPISSYALINQLKCNEKSLLSSSSFDSQHSKIKSKRIRTIFTNEQLERLEAEFDKQQYMVGNERLYLAQELHLTEGQVKVNNLSLDFLNRKLVFSRCQRFGFKIVELNGVVKLLIISVQRNKRSHCSPIDLRTC